MNGEYTIDGNVISTGGTLQLSSTAVTIYGALTSYGGLSLETASLKISGDLNLENSSVVTIHLDGDSSNFINTQGCAHLNGSLIVDFSKFISTGGNSDIPIITANCFTSSFQSAVAISTPPCSNVTFVKSKALLGEIFSVHLDNTCAANSIVGISSIYVLFLAITFFQDTFH